MLIPQELQLSLAQLWRGVYEDKGNGSPSNLPNRFNFRLW